MGRKKNIDKIRELFKKNGYTTVEEYFVVDTKDPDFNLGRVWVDDKNKFLCVDEEYNLKDWKFLLKYDITKFNHSTGFSESSQKWYGWSHRAIYGFGIGSTVKRGDIAYEPDSEEDFINDHVNFWLDDSDKSDKSNDHIIRELVYIDKDCFNPDDNGEIEVAEIAEIAEVGDTLDTTVQTKKVQTNFTSKGYKGCLISIKTSFRGEQSGRKSYISDYWAMYPPKWGKGEWTAKTLEDAHEMAIAFAKNI